LIASGRVPKTNKTRTTLTRARFSGGP
jgi:hypothetical protein